MRRLSIALIHHPVLDGRGQIVTSAITNLDVHDLARSARTYGVADYFIVHPIAAQRQLVQRIKEHWQHGSSGRRIPDRKIALEVVRVAASLAELYASLGGRDAIEVWATAARPVGQTTTSAARARLGGEGKPIVILFGTSWGLAPNVTDGADVRLAPLAAEKSAKYNHLSVRAAAAILLDRLCGERGT